MRFIANIVHLLTGGILLSLGWFFAGLLYRIPAVTRPLAGPCFELSLLCLWPAGKEAVRDQDVRQFRSFLRTGRTAGHDTVPQAPVRTRILQAALWFPAAIPLMFGHLAHGLLLALPVLANPWETRNFSLLGPAAFPLGVRVAAPSQARTMRLIGVSRRGPRYPSPVRHKRPIVLACRRVARPSATIGAACLILWASSSSNEAHLHPQSAAMQLLQQITIDSAGSPFGKNPFPRFSDTPPSLSGRRLGPPHSSPAVPPQPVVATAALPVKDALCSLETTVTAAPQLSRKQVQYGAQPLGSGKVRMGLLPASAHLAQRALNAQRRLGSAGHSKTISLLCIEAVTEKVVMSTAFAAKAATAERLARKAAPAATRSVIAGGALIHVGPQSGHAVQLRHVAGLWKWTLAAKQAKAEVVLAPEAMAKRINRAALLPDPVLVDYRAVSKAVRDAALPPAKAKHAASVSPEGSPHRPDLTAKLSIQ